MANKVRFGVSNARYALETDEGFGSWVRIPGVVQIQLEPQESQSDFYADNMNYFTQAGAASDNITLEIADLADQAKVDLLGYVQDSTSGGLVLPVNATRKSFALGFQVEGDETKLRIVIYGGKLNRPSMTHSTTSDTTEPETMSIEGKFSGKVFTVGGEDVPYLYLTTTDEGDTHTAYDAFWTAVPTPGTAPSAG